MIEKLRRYARRAVDTHFPMNIEKAGDKLGSELRASYPGVVGVSLRADDESRRIKLYVELNSDFVGIPKDVPLVYRRHKVHIRKIEIPILGGGKRPRPSSSASDTG